MSVQTFGLDLVLDCYFWRMNDLRARMELLKLANQAADDAEGFTLLAHAEVYLRDRLAYQANREGALG